MSYVAVNKPYVVPPPVLPPFRGGGEVNARPGTFSQGDGRNFDTLKPFSVQDYATAFGMDIGTAQAVLDQAVIDGDVTIT